MGRNERTSEAAPAPPLSQSDALLFTTLCIVGLPVEVQVKDGSLYSGVFHTACVDKGYGIVLKKARKIGRGKGDVNLALGVVIDTLVVPSGELVQVVVKDFLLPAEGIVGNLVENGVKTASGGVQSRPCNGGSDKEPKSLASASDAPMRDLDKNGGKWSLGMPNKHENSKIHGGLDEREVLANSLEKLLESENGSKDSIHLKKGEEPSHVPSFSVKERQVQEDKTRGEMGSCSHIIDKVSGANMVVHEVNCLSSKSYASLPQVNSVDETHVDILSKKTLDGATCGSLATLPVRPEAPESKFPSSTKLTSSVAHTSTDSSFSTSSISISDNRTSPYPSQSTSTNSLSPRENSVCNTSTKEFKLNPGAKVFLPSSANSRSAPVAPPTIGSMDYVPDIPTMMPVTGPHSSLEISSFASQLSVPPKLVQYNNLVAGHSGICAQYSWPIVGHVGIRQQPVRLTGQFHPVQAAPANVHPGYHAVMVGRLGQLMYVHPVSQDAIHGTSVLSQGLTGLPHPLLAPYQANVPKLQGSAAQSLQLCTTPPLVADGGQPFAVPDHLPFSQPFPAIQPITVPSGNVFFGSKFQ